MKKLPMIIAIFIMLSCIFIYIFGITGKRETIQVNIANNSNISSEQLGKFIKIGGNLVYDFATRIVYIENYTYANHYVYIPYYAPNGLPYKYNPETNTFEEIDNLKE